MKKVTLILMMFIASLSYSQTYELPENGTIILDSVLTKIVNTDYRDMKKKYTDPSNIEYYDYRIQGVVKKYYWVVENNLEHAIENKWFEYKFKPALNNELARRKKFINR